MAGVLFLRLYVPCEKFLPSLGCNEEPDNDVIQLELQKRQACGRIAEC